MTDLAVYYEHPAWFEPLFRVLDKRGVDYAKIAIQDHIFDPADLSAPAKVVFNRLAMSSFLRQAEHATFYTQALLTHWAAAGARGDQRGGGLGLRRLQGAPADPVSLPWP